MANAAALRKRAGACEHLTVTGCASLKEDFGRPVRHGVRRICAGTARGMPRIANGNLPETTRFRGRDIRNRHAIQHHESNSTFRLPTLTFQHRTRHHLGVSRRRWRAALVGALTCLIGLGGLAYWWPRSQQSASGVDLGTLPRGIDRQGLNLLVITLDTTRADRLGAYGYKEIETPTLDRLAADGVLFDQTMTAAPLTLPSHSSIFTSLYPPEHGVRDNGGFFLDPSHETLAANLKKRGFATGAVVGAFVLDGKWGLNQGFDSYIDDFDLSKMTGGFGIRDVKRTGADVVDRALPWLEKVKDRRFFAWLHFYDAHSPYESPEPFKSRYRTHPYSGAIAYVDSQVARVIGFLEQHQLLDRTVIAVVGDHGEGLNQHQEGTHGFFIYQSTARVPFFIRAPFQLTHGRRVPDPVRTVDLFPTALDLLGIPAPKGIAGVSLVPLMTGARPRLDLEVYAEALYPL